MDSAQDKRKNFEKTYQNTDAQQRVLPCPLHLPVTLLFQKKLIDSLAVEFYSGEILVSYEQGFPVEFLTVHDHPMALKLQY